MMNRSFYPIAISIFLVVLSVWLLSFSLDQRRVYYGNYVYKDKDIKSLSRFPGVLHELGQQSWARMDTIGAADLFRQAVARDPLHIDAWLKLAEAESEAGDVDNARKITAFCAAIAGKVMRWKRAHTLLAHELGEEEIFSKNFNYMVGHKKGHSDLFYLLDLHTNNRTEHALSLLSPENRPAYLEWLIRWKKASAAQKVWTAVEARGQVPDSLLENYVHFLVSQKRVVTAAVLWRQHGTGTGMTNAGFERELSGKGFGWRMNDLKEDKAWQGRRVFGQSHQGAHALRVSFHGRENVAWHHIYQVVPVIPEKAHQLTFWWKSKGITTDQGPFVEIYAFATQGLYKKSPMALGSRDWIQEKVRFIPPADCHAVTVRLRRDESRRFDRNIRGELWIDDFNMTVTEVTGTLERQH